MTFRGNVVFERLAFLKKALAELGKMRSRPKKDFEEEKEQWALEHGLHLTAEAVFDIGNHILTGCFDERPSNYEEILPQLAAKRVISEDLAGRFQKLGGFRNILVHDYLKVDFDKIYERLQNGLGDFKEFARQVTVWLEKRQ